ncbi:hypothetical protein [Psychrobacillus psychrodurans]|uniref:hypothetical protein n=1 Tax=Psychrobacillus psychrodurans TaxID=126157 RepID=UPI0008E1A34D|nr:hypothetical protein [Psychrobacillus psychrodurans]MCZ8540739.1 hypothetical protein [Psychrobacillus psychrodurans]SFM74418.1 hypothetical protein SAMN05421832_10685 [Psychrobacillus psychrodurans]
MEQRKKTWPKIVVIITGIFLFLVVGLLIGSFWLIGEFRESSMADEKEEEKIIEQAEQYLQKKYPDMEYEIQHVLYDESEQHGNFDYAAVILNTKTKESFMVYEDRHTEKIEDDISIQEATEFIEQVTPKVTSYINEKFGDTQGIAFTPTDDIGGIPTLNVGLNNKKEEINEEINEEMFLSLIDYLQHELNIEHASVNIMYDNDAETWSKEF